MIDKNVMNCQVPSGIKFEVSWSHGGQISSAEYFEPNFVKLWNIRIIAGKRFPVERVRYIFLIKYHFSREKKSDVFQKSPVISHWSGLDYTFLLTLTRPFLLLLKDQASIIYNN